MNKEYCIVDLKDREDLKEEVSKWFHDKWGMPTEAYLKCIESYINKETEHGWYVCLDENKIIAGLGVIENDFHDRKDLSPNVCAVYTEEEYRNQGIAGRLLNYVVDECKDKGIEQLYLVTDHIGFYERYGWEFYCMVQPVGENSKSRMYIHK